jgi:hypothetical protein
VLRRNTLVALALAGMLLVSSRIPQGALVRSAAAATNAGYIDFSFFYNPSSKSRNLIVSPTGEKPQSKLWFNDGRWWASMFSPAAGKHRIFALNWATQKWSDTGTTLDDRPLTKADCLWDGAHLYVVSGGGVVSTGRDLDARLYRYSYAGGRYRLDAGFPVTVRSGGAETITIAKDTTGTLWVTYTQGQRVYVNRSRGSEVSWGDPFVVPAGGVNTAVGGDDISAIVAYDGKVGVLWSNQNDGGFYFAYHVDGKPAGQWSGAVVARRAGYADDHISIRALQADPSGSVFAVVKTSLNTPGQPAIVVLAGSKSGAKLSWRAVTVTDGALGQTRPILLLDTSNRRMYVFTADESGGTIYYKAARLDNLVFNTNAKGSLFIRNDNHPFFNDPTSTKQNVNATTNLVVLASYDNGSHPSATPATTDVYAHNVIDIPRPPLDKRVYIAVVRG